MAVVTFWEKPGCAGNARQKALLEASGHTVQARDLRAEHWTAATLRRFFGARPVAAWFNRSSPRVKSGEVQPEQLDEAAALALMLADPLLIRRPLLQVGERCEAGFDPILVAGWIGLTGERPWLGDACQHPQGPPCAEPVAITPAGE
ncbi:Uncharacterized 15.7 kDa protein in draG 3'region [Rhodovastum atsumiense]|uniref:Nitrogenase-associated protein n=1 Tax=Rhodovastum atsumiense TaxID=504468 RepID=A0A5M6IYZ6_9PROT|nr:hypothetical protein F1189_05495 [Rhodovastum atsumiense]CAH2603259.1 Uncharacterized 15.7 kDa protein in draG 3'region [Rhodovastum atsumiense]